MLQTLFINKFHVKSVLKLSVKCATLLHILKKVRFIAFRRVTCIRISPQLYLPKLLQWSIAAYSVEDLVLIGTNRLVTGANRQWG